MNTLSFRFNFFDWLITQKINKSVLLVLTSYALSFSLYILSYVFGHHWLNTHSLAKQIIKIQWIACSVSCSLVSVDRFTNSSTTIQFAHNQTERKQISWPKIELCVKRHAEKELGMHKKRKLIKHTFTCRASKWHFSVLLITYFLKTLFNLIVPVIAQGVQDLCPNHFIGSSRRSFNLPCTRTFYFYLGCWELQFFKGQLFNNISNQAKNVKFVCWIFFGKNKFLSLGYI